METALDLKDAAIEPCPLETQIVAILGSIRSDFFGLGWSKCLDLRNVVVREVEQDEQNDDFEEVSMMRRKVFDQYGNMLEWEADEIMYWAPMPNLDFALNKLSLKLGKP